MFQKRKKFTDESTPEKRMTDRWEQQVFFITKKFPNSESQITKIMKDFGADKAEDFVPSEEALDKLASLYSELLAMHDQTV